MNKNLKKILIINLFVVLMAVLIAEIFAYSSYRIKYADLVRDQANLCDNPEECIKQNMPHYSLPKKIQYEDFEYDIKDRVYKSKNPQKRPIVTIGCSYTDGATLEENQTFAYKLNQMTGRTTYNRGISASGPQLVYRQLTDKNFKKEVPDAEYVIYTFIHHHLCRQFLILMNPFTSDINIQYRIKNGKLVEYYSPLSYLSFSFIIKSYLEYKNTKDFQKEFQEGLPLFTKYMEESVKQTKKLYPNSKFVLLEFPQSDICNANYEKGLYELTQSQIETIEKLGIIYVKASDLVGHNFCEDKYRMEDKDHPSEIAWEEFVPKLVKKLNL